MTDYKQLCAELVNMLEDYQWRVRESRMDWTGPDADSLIKRARAELAKPELIDPAKEKAASAAENQLFPWRQRDAALSEPDPEGVAPSSVPVVYTEAMAADDDELLKGVTIDD